MAKKAKEAAPVAPVTSNVISLDMIATASQSDPFYMFVPAEVSAGWLANGFVETNPEMVDANGAHATRITEAGKAHITMNANTDTTNAGTAAASTPAPANEFVIETIDMPAESRAPAAQNAAKYPFDALTAPTTGEDGKPKVAAFFIPATAARPEPWKTLASTVSTAKSRYGTKTGERPYKGREAVVGADGKPVLGADGKPTYNEVQKTRTIYDYSREFRITEGVKKNAEGVDVKGAWVSRIK